MSVLSEPGFQNILMLYITHTLGCACINTGLRCLRNVLHNALHIGLCMRYVERQMFWKPGSGGGRPSRPRHRGVVISKSDKGETRPEKNLMKRSLKSPGLPVWINFREILKFLCSENVYLAPKIVPNWQPWKLETFNASKLFPNK